VGKIVNFAPILTEHSDPKSVMSKVIKIKKGLDINLAGKARQEVSDLQSETYALKPTDFHGIARPKVLVEEGSKVKAGTPILLDKWNEKAIFCSPVSGEIAEIVRGEKRKLLEIRILADTEVEFESFPSHSPSDLQSLSRQAIVDQMLAGGVWPNITQRPYGVVAQPDVDPKAIHISSFDTHPLSPDYAFILKGEEANFQAGLTALSKLTSGAVHLNVDAKAEVSPIFERAEGVQINKFTGPHPAGNVGVQIHHLDAINKGDVVWTLTPVGVAEIGRLFLEGKYDTRTLIAVAGSEVKDPKYFRAYKGASVKKMLANNLNQENVRVVSGNALTGEAIPSDGYVGFGSQLVTVLPEGNDYELFGWILPTTKKHSFHRALGLLSFLNPKKEYVIDTNTHGEKRAFVQTGVFEEVTPMDIHPMHLLKAVLAEDYDDMEALGMYEVLEEDLALCEYIDVSKHDVQDIVRQGLELLRNS